jgi:translation initiation factor IF-2
MPQPLDISMMRMVIVVKPLSLKEAGVGSMERHALQAVPLRKNATMIWQKQKIQLETLEMKHWHRQQDFKLNLICVDGSAMTKWPINKLGAWKTQTSTTVWRTTLEPKPNSGLVLEIKPGLGN